MHQLLSGQPQEALWLMFMRVIIAILNQLEVIDEALYLNYDLKIVEKHLP